MDMDQDRFPPGPRPLLPFSLLWRLRRQPAYTLQELAAAYGDFVYFKIGPRRFYFLNHPDYVQEVLIGQNSALIKGRGLQRAQTLLGQGLLTSEGGYHLQQRRLMQPAFHRQRITTYAATMVAYTNQYIQGWSDGGTRDVHADMMALTLAIAGKTLFNADIEEEAGEVSLALNVFMGLTQRLLSPLAPLLDRLPLPGNRRAERAAAQLDELIYRLIAERRREGDKGDLLSMLIVAQEEGREMSDRQLRDEALTLLLAGHETTAVALSWTLYLLAQHPAVLARLQQEVDGALSGRTAVAGDTAHLSYMRMVLSEAMRLYPPAWIITREAVRPVTIGDYTIPGGATLLVSQWTMHRDSRYYPQPDQFAPERWQPQAQANRPRWAYFPFGGGGRVCIGEQFAWMEATLVLATLLQQWQPSPDPTAKAAPHFAVTLRPQPGLTLNFSRRQTIDH